MIAFWVVAGVLTAAAAGLILSRAARAATQGEAQDPTPAVYRRQLAEIDELAERGLIGEAERKSAHAEAGRRLLAAADQPVEVWTSEPGARRPVLIAVMLAPALALGLYLALGSPGMPDQPFVKRLAAWQASSPASLTPPELAAVLQRLTQQRPNDPEGFRYLAIAEGASEHPAEAVRALRKAVRIAPQRADLWELLGEALVFESGGPVTDDAKAAFQEALKRDPKAVAPRFHLARARIADGDRAGGLADWRALLADLPPDDTRRAALTAAIAEAQGQPEAAPALSPEQLTAVQGMVAGLAQRLQASPDDPEGWVRLVRAYAVLGDKAKRDHALADAKARYAGRSDILQQLDASARAEPMR